MMKLIDILLLDSNSSCLSLSLWHRVFLVPTEQLVFQGPPDHLVHLASPEKMEQVDCQGPRFVLHSTARQAVKLIHFSAFSGLHNMRVQECII